MIIGIIGQMGALIIGIIGQIGQGILKKNIIIINSIYLFLFIFIILPPFI